MGRADPSLGPAGAGPVHRVRSDSTRHSVISHRSDLSHVESSIPGFTKPGGTSKSTLIGKIGNFSVQYNLGAASIALAFMTSRDDEVLGSDSGSRADYPEPDWVKYTLLGTVFAGAVCGMLSLGRLGDPELLGRNRALVVTLAFVVLGSLGSAIVPWGSTQTIYGIICGFRFLVGVGVGGIYPLSATHSAEAGAEECDDDELDEEVLRQERVEAAGRVGWAFFWQVPGQMAPYVVALVLVGIHEVAGSSFSTSVQWRLLYGIGALPAAVVLLLTLREIGAESETEEQTHLVEQSAAGAPQTAWQEVRNSPEWPELRRALIGACGTWFLYDISFYGTNTFLPTILKDIFGDSDSLAGICWQSILSIAFGIPGVIIGIKVQQWRESRFNFFWGFVAMFLLFGALGLVYAVWEDGHVLLFGVFLLLNCSLNAGPSVATYVYPAMVFPVAIRSAAHGMASASAKMGAVVGTFMYPPISDQAGFATVMFIQCGLSAIGAVWTLAFVPHTDRVITCSSRAPGIA
eukprot:TRINITY_DN5032_c0_g1_i1.p1 TRINITY_DN5032_c0_g1~~TRINITY_DN5032_c0_g1_i1.p1  ORF type:complete len:547 (+),score=123.32 TRINITY_DN5032_c0_g1_i1:90-1643(+)